MCRGRGAARNKVGVGRKIIKGAGSV